MAKIFCALGVVVAKGVGGLQVEALKSVPEGSEKLTSAAGWAAGTLTSVVGQMWNITVSGGAIEVTFDVNTPGVGVAGKWMIPDGGSMPFSVSVAGEKFNFRDLA
jgi:hypothetical protein